MNTKAVAIGAVGLLGFLVGTVMLPLGIALQYEGFNSFMRLYPHLLLWNFLFFPILILAHSMFHFCFLSSVVVKRRKQFWAALMLMCILISVTALVFESKGNQVMLLEVKPSYVKEYSLLDHAMYLVYDVNYPQRVHGGDLPTSDVVKQEFSARMNIETVQNQAAWSHVRPFYHGSFLVATFLFLLTIGLPFLIPNQLSKDRSSMLVFAGASIIMFLLWFPFRTFYNSRVRALLYLDQTDPHLGGNFFMGSLALPETTMLVLLLVAAFVLILKICRFSVTTTKEWVLILSTLSGMVLSIAGMQNPSLVYEAFGLDGNVVIWLFWSVVILFTAFLLIFEVVAWSEDPPDS